MGFMGSPHFEELFLSSEILTLFTKVSLSPCGFEFQHENSLYLIYFFYIPMYVGRYTEMKQGFYVGTTRNVKIYP
jgi:hypothetical protein